MKNVKKIFGLFASFMLLAGAFTACSDSDGGNGNDSENVEYLSEGAEVTVNSGESVTVHVQGKTNVEGVTAEGVTVEYIGDDAFKIKAEDSSEDATIALNFNDGTDSDDGINVTLYVYNPYYILTITLDAAVAEKASTVEVYAEGKEDGETTAALYQSVTADYTAGETTATARLEKAKANSYNYFNNIVITVKDSAGETIDVEANPVYFCYSATTGVGYLDEDGIKVTAAVSEKTFTIKFEGFTVAGGSVSGLKYSTKWANSSSEWDEAYVVTPTVTVSEDGTSASFTVASTSEFYIDWTAVVVKDSEGNAVTISSGNTDGNKWYGYSEDVWSNTLTHVSGEYVNLCSEKAFTASSSYVQVVEASAFEELNISTLKVVVKLSSASDGEWWASASSAGEYAAATYQELSWSDDDGGYSAVITSETFITGLKTNGLYLNVDSAAVGTVTVDYIAN
ncbi:hypothetical protein [Treponema sp.]|uniref:hypothetical protein n=1 Tax=Treponema sp. TaxID=166 RepID=UPI0025806304|nr:hypothetical protein [Treponema sp.]MBE6354783.1 hypothetical protein [Treponema sp.]